MSPAIEKLPATLRIPFVRKCSVKGLKAGDSEAMLLDLSLRGVYIASDASPEVGEKLALSFQVPGNARVLELAGLVAWVQGTQTHPVHGLPKGFGVRFQKLEVEDVRLIARTIQAYCQSNPIYRQYL